MPSPYYPFPPLKKKRLIAGYNKSSWKSSFFKVSRPARCAHTAPVIQPIGRNFEDVCLFSQGCTNNFLTKLMKIFNLKGSLNSKRLRKQFVMLVNFHNPPFCLVYFYSINA